MSRDPSRQFARLVHQILVVERVRPMREVAAELELPYATFYSRLNGRVPFRPNEIQKLIRVIPDSRIVEWLLARTEFIAVKQTIRYDFDAEGGPLETASRSVEHAVAVWRDLCTAGDRNHLDNDRHARIEQHIREAQRDLAALQYVLAH